MFIYPFKNINIPIYNIFPIVDMGVKLSLIMEHPVPWD
jgi:hypothetical protein